MPEGPEVRRVYEDLKNEITDAEVVELTVIGGRFSKKPPVGLDKVSLPAKITGGGVKGKFMWLELGERTTMWITLGMSGFWSTEPLPHSHFSIRLADGRLFYFVDQRRFGTIKFSHDRSELEKKISQLGHDLLNDPGVTLVNFIGRMRKQSTKTIVEVLMNQNICAGVGNYIKCEALYRARISPHRRVESIDPHEMAVLFDWIKKIMEASYLQGGASIRNYQRVSGEKGLFVFEFEVYGKRVSPNGNEVVREETLDGRTTHWVPSEQS